MHLTISYGIVRKKRSDFGALVKIKVRADQHEDCDCTAK